MSDYTYVDVVPFVLHNLWEGNDLHDLAGKSMEVMKLYAPECWAEEYATEEEQASIFLVSIPGKESPERFRVRDWTYEGSVEFGKRQRLFGEAWIKIGTDTRVILVNESQYSAGGAYEVGVVADTEASIQMFLVDFADLIQPNRLPIEADDTAQITC